MQKEKDLRKYWQKLFYKALMKCRAVAQQDTFIIATKQERNSLSKFTWVKLLLLILH